jgi:hypothetical protein
MHIAVDNLNRPGVETLAVTFDISRQGASAAQWPANEE